jgi:hypothetical protein
MSRVFAVMRVRGPRWKAGVMMDEQEDWREHAVLMDDLVQEGFVLLGGPLRGTDDVLLIVRAEGEQPIHARFAEDIWTKKDLLRTKWVAEWWVRLGEERVGRK